MTAPGFEEFLARGRAAAEDLQRDRIHLWMPGPDVFDRATGTTTPGPPLVDYYTGEARVKPVASSEEVTAAEREITLTDFEVSVPWSTAVTERPLPGAVIDVLAAPDTRMVGLRLWVTGVKFNSTATAWRIRAEVRA
ncbi:DUF6093 family protein [Streptomyces niveiscabiei]|uniref:DUF6093 family protein n=1 Tax=Streptomyces niveiscabiei TaxID=164115 RepID=UPI0006EB4647|nr:DUF6093 family protein [Streptomyces niveiscabiei]